MGRLSASPSEDFDGLFQTLAHRGPDASHAMKAQSGRWLAEFGHHRLSIIDVAGGAQPMQSGSQTLIFNGEIYNFEILRQRYSEVAWRSRSDSEVVLEAIRHQGVDALPLLDGFFSLGIFDAEKRQLLLARDRWGIKPLYYALLEDGGILFGSELHPFLHASGIRREASVQTLVDFLYWDHVPYDRSLLAGVHKLEPGHYLRWSDGAVEIHPFYEPLDLLRAPRRPIRTDELWTLVTDSVKAALISDVPVGILLSGGLDSSLLAVAAKKVLGHGLPSFSIGFAEAEFDESVYARQVANLLGAEHFERRLTANDMLERWEEIVTSLDEPLGDPSLIPMRFLCELARQHVPVVLGGDGGDELFGGYPTYRAQRLRPWLEWIPPGTFEVLRDLTREHLHLSDGYQPLAWKVKRLIGRFGREPLNGHFRWMSGTDLPELKGLAGAGFAPALRDLVGLDAEDLQSYLYLDLRHYLPYSVLTKVDRASMAVGLECRPPLLSNACVERAFQIPVDQKVNSRQTKLILREVARAHLPSEIVERSKRGFAIPLSRWLKGPLAPAVEGLLKDSPLWEGLSAAFARKMWSEFKSGTGDHSKSFWSLLVLHKWLVAHDVKVRR